MTGDDHVIIYDGQCRFCTRFANWCARRQPGFRIMQARHTDSRALLREKGTRFVDLQTIYYIEKEEVFVRSKAVFGIFRHLGFPWTWFSACRFLPAGLTDFFYKLFAKYRYYV